MAHKKVGFTLPNEQRVYGNPLTHGEANYQNAMKYAHAKTIAEVAVLQPRSVLDLGCGKDPFLAIWCAQNNIKYTGVDNGLEMYGNVVKYHVRELYNAVPEDLRSLITVSEDDMFNYMGPRADLVVISHVLQHLQPMPRKHLLELVYDHFAKSAILVAAYDWRPMYEEVKWKSYKNAAHQDFVLCALALMDLIGSKPYFGAPRVFQSFVRKIFPSEIIDFRYCHRPYFYDEAQMQEVIELCRMMILLSDRLQQPGIKGDLEYVLENMLEVPYAFTPAHLAFATVYKS